MSITAFWCNCRQYIPAFRRKRTLYLECCKCLKFKFQTHVIFISHSFFVIVVWSKCWSYFFIFPWHLKMSDKLHKFTLKNTLRKKCPYSQFFCSAFSCIPPKYGKMRSISPYSVWLRENTEQKNSEYRHFSGTDILK